jgi:hypothetical protein
MSNYSNRGQYVENDKKKEDKLISLISDRGKSTTCKHKI